MLNTRHLMHKRPLPVRSYSRQVARRLRSDPFVDWTNRHTRRRLVTWKEALWLLTFGVAVGVALAYTLITHP
jgi:GH43 family beta-xylosidase